MINSAIEPERKVNSTWIPGILRNSLLTIIFLLSIISTGQIKVKQSSLPNWRPYDQSGINNFEGEKDDSSVFESVQVRFGVGFTQQFQALRHWNEAVPVYNSERSVNYNQLKQIGPGFNPANVNLYMDAVLTDGVRLSLASYISSRHNPHTELRSSYIQIDKMEFLKCDMVDRLMKNITIRLGHMEVNYGDAHFFRTDNGHALYNPLVGNYILEAFTTEVGAEVYYKNKGFLAMAAITNGELVPDVSLPGTRRPSFYGKLAYDRELGHENRARLSVSYYGTQSSALNTLYDGDRAGSRYYLVMENVEATSATRYLSGTVNPELTHQVNAFQINPFIKLHKLELLELPNSRPVTRMKEKS